MKGTPAERANFRFIGNGTGIHWPELDEDISIEAISLAADPATSSHHFNTGFRVVEIETCRPDLNRYSICGTASLSAPILRSSALLTYSPVATSLAAQIIFYNIVLQ